jgi:nucleotide-binding universal stress UspA family protein
VSGLYRLIGCCVDDSEAAAGALAESARLAGIAGARLAALHVVPSGDDFTGGRTAFMPSPDELARGLRDDGRRWLVERLGAVAGTEAAEPVVLQGNPVEEVVAWAEASECDLLVAAAHRRGLARAILGSFTRTVARDAPCSVLVYRLR